MFQLRENKKLFCLFLNKKHFKHKKTAPTNGKSGKIALKISKLNEIF